MLAFDFETTDPRWNGTFQPTRARMIGVSCARSETEAVYFAGDHIPPALAQILESDGEKCAHNAVFEYIVARTHGVRVRNLHDTKLMAYVLRTSTTYLKGLSWAVLGVEQTHFDEVDWDDPKQVVNYAGADAALTYMLYGVLRSELVRQGLLDLYETERRLIPVIGEMALRGILIDPEPLARLRSELEAELPALRADILSACGGVEVNLDSAQKLAELLYGPARPRPRPERELRGRRVHDPECQRKGCSDYACVGGVRTGAQTVLRWLPPGLGWPVRVRTETGQPATDMNTLRLYTGPVVNDLVRYKSIQRVVRNDLTNLVRLRHEDGRIHPTFHASGHWEERGPGGEAPITGRFSSSGPNLQNVTNKADAERPYVVEWGNQIRRAFVASPGTLLIRADIGQEEPRIGALISHDDELLRELETGDVYKPVAALEYGCPVGEVDRERRQIGKRGWMAWLNGAGPAGIQQSAFWLTRAEAEKVVRFLANRHPLVEQERMRLVRALWDTGYTETWFKRRVYRPAIWSGPGPARDHAERSVMPDRIQGTAADVMKIWLTRLSLPETAHLLLTVHDEIVLEVPPTDLKETGRELESALAGILPIHLPLEMSIGMSWGEMLPYTPH